MDDNRKFWNRFAFIYEKVQTAGTGNRKFYHQLAAEIVKQLRPDMKVLELAMGTALLTEGIAKQCNYNCKCSSYHAGIQESDL